MVNTPWNWHFRPCKWMVGRWRASFLGWPIFRGELLVLGRVSHLSHIEAVHDICSQNSIRINMNGYIDGCTGAPFNCFWSWQQKILKYVAQLFPQGRQKIVAFVNKTRFILVLGHLKISTAQAHCWSKIGRIIRQMYATWLLLKHMGVHKPIYNIYIEAPFWKDRTCVLLSYYPSASNNSKQYVSQSQKKHQGHETKPPWFFRALCFLRPQPLSLWYESGVPFFVDVGRRRVVWSWRFVLLLWDELFIFRSKPTQTNIPIEPSTLFEFGSSY